MNRWLEKLYKTLRDNFGDKPFSFQQAAEALQLKGQLGQSQARVGFTELRKYGLVKTKPDPDDARKRIYIINPRKEGPGNMSSQDLRSPEKVLDFYFTVTDVLRKREGERFLPVLVSYQVGSEAGELEDKAVRREWTRPGLAFGKSHPEFVVPPGCRWGNLAKHPARIVATLTRGLKAATQHNPAIGEAFPVADFLRFAEKPENADAIKQYVILASAVPLHRLNLNAPNEFYRSILALSTIKSKQRGVYLIPLEPVQILTEVLEPGPGDSIYDPCLGFGTTFVQCQSYFKKRNKGTEGSRLSFCGQDPDAKNLTLVRQYMFLNGVTDVELSPGDALVHPLLEGEKLKKFELVISCPPWGRAGYPEGLIQKSKFWNERYRYGLPSRIYTEGAWLQVALASTTDGGRAGLLLPSGFLSRGGRDRDVREGIVKDDILDAVIMLPPKALPSAPVPGAIIILNKRKHHQRKGKVLFIQAGKEAGGRPGVSGQGRLGEEEHRRIVQVYRDFRKEAGLSRVVSTEEIQASGFTLLPSAYSKPLEKAGGTDVAKAWETLAAWEGAVKDSYAQLETILREMGLLNASKGEKL